MASTKPVFNDVQEPRNLRALSFNETESVLSSQASVTVAQERLECAMWLTALALA